MPQALDLHRAALLVLDWQRFFVSPDSPACIPEAADAEPNIEALVDAFLAARRPVFATRHGHARGESGTFMRFYGRVLFLDDPQSELSPFLKDREGVTPVEKSTYSAFASGELVPQLASRGVSRIVIAGCQTDKCVVANALAAFDLGFDVAAVSDACAARSRERGEAALALLQRCCAAVTGTREIRESLAQVTCGGEGRP